jgi:hypothetical protein
VVLRKDDSVREQLIKRRDASFEVARVASFDRIHHKLIHHQKQLSKVVASRHLSISGEKGLDRHPQWKLGMLPRTCSLIGRGHLRCGMAEHLPSDGVEIFEGRLSVKYV